LFAGASKLVVPVFDLRQNFVPAGVEVFQISFEFVRRLFSGSFDEQVLSSVVDVLQTSGTILQLTSHLLITAIN